MNRILRKEKLILIGLDGALYEHILKFSKQGKLRNISKLIRSGMFARAVPSPPADTPTNWTTIETGAWTGTHGVTSFLIHRPGEALDTMHEDVFDSRWCQADTLWEAAERAGKKCILLNYPVAWPPKIKNGIVIGGYGIFGHNDWKIAGPNTFYTRTAAQPAKRTVYDKIRFSVAKHPTNLPKSHTLPLTASFEITPGGDALAWFGEGDLIKTGDFPSAGKNSSLGYTIVLVDLQGNGFDKAFIYKKNNLKEPVAVLMQGEWSNWIYDSFLLRRIEQGAFRFKLIKLSPDGKEVVLFRSSIGRMKSWAWPSRICRDIVNSVGPFINGLEVDNSKDMDTWFENIRFQTAYFANLCEYLCSNNQWDILAVQIHVQDTFNHRFIRSIEPPVKDRERERFAWKAFENSYQFVDEMIGNIAKTCSDKNTTIMVVSDHGIFPVCRRFAGLERIFREKGLLKAKKNKKTDDYIVDWQRTKAFPSKGRFYVWVNLKGRDPHGIVQTGKEYEKIRDEIIDVLYGIVDPATGHRVVAVALRAEDAQMWGQEGPRLGDIFYLLKPGYDAMLKRDNKNLIPKDTFMPASREGAHTSCIPTVRFVNSSMSGICIISGPRIRKGYTPRQSINLVDIAPTASYVLNMKPPKNTEGRVLNVFQRKSELPPEKSK